MFKLSWPAAVALLLCTGFARAQPVPPQFAQCASCHAATATAGVGPGLLGVVGRLAGTAPGFRYSPAMKRARFAWDEAKLDAFLADPQKVVPGTLMPYSGMPSASDRAAVIAWLKTLAPAQP
jgi:cytochrome c